MPGPARPTPQGTFLPDVIGNPANQVANLEAGGAVQQANDPANGYMPPTAAQHITDMQQFLKNRGYAITVDGIRGPQTNAAVAAFHNHIPAAQFNARYRTQHPATGRFQPTNKPVIPAKTFDAQHPGNNPGGPTDRVPTVPAANNSGINFDPRALAQAEANAQYNPAIADLTNQISAAGNQNVFNQQALSDYYTQMQNLIASQLTGVKTQGSQGANQYATDLGNVAQLFGGAQAPQVGAGAQIDANALSSENQNQQDYLNNMQPLLKAQGAQGLSDLMNAYGAQNNSLHSQLQAQQQAKGAAFNSNYQQALQNKVQLQQNQQALNDAQALFPYQLSSAKSQAAADATNAAAAGKLNDAKLAQVQSATDKNFAEAKAALNKGASFAPGSKDRQTLIGNLYKSMVNSAGTAIIGNPIQAQRALYTQAVAYGLIDQSGKELVPGASTALQAVLQNVLASTPSWRNAGWQWNGTTFVQNKK